MTFHKATEYCFSDWEIFALHKSKNLTEKKKKRQFLFFLFEKKVPSYNCAVGQVLYQTKTNTDVTELFYLGMLHNMVFFHTKYICHFEICIGKRMGLRFFCLFLFSFFLIIHVQQSHCCNLMLLKINATNVR